MIRAYSPPKGVYTLAREDELVRAGLTGTDQRLSPLDRSSSVVRARPVASIGIAKCLLDG